MARIAVVVDGMHRSGTSATARAINLLGYRTAQRLIPPAPDNPKGFWEPANLARLNDRLLAHLNRRWDDPRPIVPSALAAAALTPLFGEASAFIADSFETGDAAFTIKDPRFSRLRPFWSRVLAAAGVEAYWVHVVRNPVEVALSLAARNGIGTEQATLLWAAHVLDAMHDDAVGATKPTAVLAFDELIAAPGATLARALEALRLSPPSPETLAVAAASIASEDQHYRLGTDAVLQNPALSDLVKRLHVELRLAIRSSVPLSSSQTLRGLHDRWLDAWDVMSPVLAPISFPTLAPSPVELVEENSSGSSPSSGKGTTIVRMHPFCPICGATDFIEFNNRPQARCANCGAMERTRLLYGILNRQGVLSPKMSVLHLAPEPGLAGRLRRLATRYVPADIDISQYLTFLPEIQRLDLCDFQSGDLGHFDLILHMHVLEHVPCSIDTVLRKLGQSLNPGGRMYFSVPIRSAAETDEDLNPSLTGDERKVRFGQHDHQRIFGDADVVEMFRRALGPDLHLVDPLAYFTQQEVRLMGVKIDVGKLSGHSIFCHQA